jgi:hypothetical protein
MVKMNFLPLISKSEAYSACTVSLCLNWSSKAYIEKYFIYIKGVSSQAAYRHDSSEDPNSPKPWRGRLPWLPAISSFCPVTSFHLLCLGSTDAHCPRLGAPVPLPPKWRPSSQGLRTLPYRGPTHLWLRSDLLIKVIFSVALVYFDFEPGDFYEILHLDKNLTVSFLNKSAAWMAPMSLTWVCCLSTRSIYVSSESSCRFFPSHSQ